MPQLGPTDLTSLNTLGLPGRAEYPWRLDDLNELNGLHHFLQQHDRRALVVGGGSNLLLARDLSEPLILMRTRGRRLIADNGHTAVIEVAAGETWDTLVRWTLKQGLCGLENLILIPGSVGAAPWQNIGAYGVELAMSVVSIDAWHQVENRLATFDRDTCDFGYRHSVFQQPGAEDWMIVTVRLALSRALKPHLDYGDVRTELGLDNTSANTTALSTTRIAAAIERIRRRKLPDPAALCNAGSFFKNPRIDSATAARLQASTGTRSSSRVPVYPSQGSLKTSAAWLIEACGWKGYRDGPVGVSPQHALVLVNYGGASGPQLLALARRIQASVMEQFGIELEPEPRIIA